MKIDILQFLRDKLEKPGTPLFYADPIKRKLMWRLYCMKMGMRRELSGREMFRGIFMSQSRKRDVDDKITASIRKNCNVVFEKAGLYDKPDALLWGQTLYPEPVQNAFESWYWTFILLLLIVRGDQYRTKQFLRSRCVVIDAGANIGIYAIMAARIASAGTIYAFEPSGGVYEVLARNVFPYSNVKIEKAALGESECQGRRLVVDVNSTISSTLSDSGVSEIVSSTSEMVPVTTIDSYVNKKRIERVDFIKMDVEGYESKVLSGAEKIIRRDTPSMVMSAYHKPEDIVELPRQVAAIEPRYKMHFNRNIETDLVCNI